MFFVSLVLLFPQVKPKIPKLVLYRSTLGDLFDRVASAKLTVWPLGYRALKEQSVVFGEELYQAGTPGDSDDFRGKTPNAHFGVCL